MAKLNCLCASENQVSDDVEDFDDTSAYHERRQRLYLENFMASHHFDGFEQGDESTHSIHGKDTTPMEKQDEETRQRAPQGNRGLKRVYSTSSVDTCTTVSLSQSFMHDDDEVCSTVPTEDVKILQKGTPFRSKRRTNSKHEHEAYRHMQRMRSVNYIRED
jgi:hypothetical protein